MGFCRREGQARPVKRRLSPLIRGRHGSIHFVCMDWRHVGEMLEAGAANYAELRNMIVWVKDNGGMGSFYRSRHELIFAFKIEARTH
jgi:hypothetical protein